MLRYVVRRLFLLVPILIGVSLLIFFWIRALPGNPADALLGERSNAQLVQQYKQRYGLDRPIPVQYWDYVKTTLGGDLGTSISTRRAVTAEIKQRFPATIELAVAAMLFAVALGIPLGFFAAKRHGGVFDNLTMIGSLLGISVPIFFLAIILKYIFAVRLHWLPSVGRIDVLSNAKASDELLHPRCSHHARLAHAVGRDQTPDPPGHRARVDPPRHHHADYARRRAGMCKTRTTSAPRVPRACRRSPSTAVTCCGTRCSPSRRSSVCRPGCCSPGQS